MDLDLAQRLRALRDALARVPEGADDEAVGRAQDRLERDLLPRTAAAGGAVVAGIVGPNNAGKSALFNGLAGAVVSPSLPTGGATRRLVGAARAPLARELTEMEAWGRFEVVPWDTESDSELPTRAPERPAQLLLTASAQVPESVLLIDTPDFDSVARENRAASEALLAVADVVIVVVTRHTYQNAEVVEYLRRWLVHGRPWILVYNEAARPELVDEHAAKLAQDVGHAPLAIFGAPYDAGVMDGERPLIAREGARPDGRPLAEMLADTIALRELKRSALDASLAQLRDDVVAIADRLDERALRAGKVVAQASQAARDLGFRIAGEAMPAGPFLAAFRAVLDRRSNRVSRRWRAGLQGLRVRLEALPRAIGLMKEAPEPERVAGGLEAVETKVLERLWPAFHESLARDLGAEARSPARRDCPAPLAHLLDADLARPTGERRDAARAALAELPVEFGRFQKACEELVERGLDERGSDWDIQAAADLATLLPVAIAAAVIVKTGGFAADVGAAAGGAVTTFLFEKYSHVLGSQIVAEAGRRWQGERGGGLAEAFLAAALPTAREPLLRASLEDRELSHALRGLLEGAEHNSEEDAA
ncbi:GTPase [Engelhardtia mirabilis]|uniref:GTPase Der n=1 Tax=Engelhardtia mirabilis TaxID=2528011 RepID=A0A518BNC1_9BACT|nr:GTPase Der [Planctomycetes bacterium Pla133]QDV02803.1 GTPase Der [Planctomycetes bacterium Pla86]